MGNLTLRGQAALVIRSTVRRGQLLPKSGVGVIAPWLVIAPPGNPTIKLDLRLLDRVEIRPEAEDGDSIVDEQSDHERRCDVLLACNDLADGPEAARRIVDEAAPWTRENAGAEKPLPVAAGSDRASRPASYGRLVVVSSTPDAETRVDDDLAGYMYELTEPVMLVGRSRENDIIINHSSISREHAKVKRDPSTGRYAITDVHAMNGLRVNGERCIGIELEDGDIIDFGHVRTRFIAPGEEVEDQWRASPSPDPDDFLIVGRDVVLHRGELIQVGSIAFRIEQVEQYAQRGAHLPLTGGRLLQAAMALLVVAVATRETEPST